MATADKVAGEIHNSPPAAELINAVPDPSLTPVFAATIQAASSEGAKPAGLEGSTIEVAAPSNGIGSRVAGAVSWGLGTVFWGAGELAKGAARKVVSYAAMPSQEQNDREIVRLQGCLNKLTGSNHFSCVIMQLAPIIEDFVCEKLAAYPSISMFLGETDIKMMVRKTFLQVVCNFLIYAEQQRDPDNPSQQHLIMDALGILVHLLEAHLPGMRDPLSNIAGILKDTNASAKVSNYQAVFKPLASQFFSIAFPNGAQDIKVPWPVNKKIWDFLQYLFIDHNSESGPLVSRVISENSIVEIYDGISSLFKELDEPLSHVDQCKERITAHPGGAQLLDLIHTMTDVVIPDHIGDWVADNHSSIANLAVPLLFQDPEAPEAKWVEGWLGVRLREYKVFAEQDGKGMNQFICRYMESLLCMVIEKMLAQHTGTSSATVDAAPLLLAQIVKQVSRSLEDNKNGIRAILANIKMWESQKGKREPQDIKENIESSYQELEVLFAPIAVELLRVIRIEKAEDMPVPPFMQKLAHEQMIAIMPKMLLALFMNGELYLDLLKPESLPKKQHDAVTGKESLDAIVRELWAEHKGNIRQVIADSKDEVGGLLIDKLEESLPGIQLGNSGKSVLSAIIGTFALSDDEDINRVLNFAGEEVYDTLLRVMEHLAASYPVTRTYESAAMPKDILADAILHLLCVGGDKLRGLEQLFRVRYEELERLKAENQETEEAQDRLRELFVPFAEKLLATAGYENNRWAEILRTKLIPDVIATFYKDFLIEAPLPAELQEQLAKIEGTDRLEEVSQQMACFASSKIKETLIRWTEEKTAVDEMEDEEDEELALVNEHWGWLDQALFQVAHDQGFGITKLQEFIQGYLSKVVHGVLLHLACSQREEGEIVRDPLSAAVMNGMKILSHEMSQTEEKKDLDRRLFDGLIAYHQIDDDVEHAEEKKAARTHLLELIQPLADAILTNAGLASHESLRIPSFLQQKAWAFLKEKVLPDLLLDVYEDIRFKTTRHQDAMQMEGHGELELCLDNLTCQLFPLALPYLDDPSLELDSAISDVLNEKGVSAMPISWIKNTLNSLAHSDTNPNVRKAWEIIRGFIALKAFDAVTHIAVGDGNNGSQNILTNLVVNALSILQRNLGGKENELKEAISRYDNLSAVLKILDKAREILLLAGPTDREWSALANQVLADCHFDTEEDKTALVEWARKFLDKQESLESDGEIVINLLFGPANLNSQDRLERLDVKIRHLKQSRTDVLKTSFVPIATDVLEASGLGTDAAIGLPGAGTLYDLDHVRDELIPLLMMRMFREVTEAGDNYGEYRVALREMLHTNDNEQEEIEETAAYLEEMCGILSYDITRIAREYIAENPEDIKEFLPAIMENLKDLVSAAAKEVCEKDNPAVENASRCAAEMIRTAVIKVFVNLARTTEAIFPVVEHENPYKMLIANMMIRMVKLVADQSGAIKVRLQEIKESGIDEKEKEKQAQQVFHPLAKEILQMSLPNGENDFPLPVCARGFAYQVLETSILPSILEKLYRDVWGWEDEAATNKEKLRGQFLSTHAEEFVHVISRFGADKVNQYFRAQSEELADLLLTAFNGYLMSKENGGVDLATQLEIRRETLRGWVSENIRKGFSLQDPSMDQLWSSTHDYIESILLRMFSNVFGKISEKEDGKSDYLISTTLKALELLVKHFRRISLIVQAHDVRHAFDIDPSAILREYNDGMGELDEHLASSQEYIDAKIALTTAEEALRRANFGANRVAMEEAVKQAAVRMEQIRMRELFTPIITSFLEIAGIKSADDMPYPSPIKEVMWDLSREKLFPLLAGSIVDMITDFDNLNKLFTVLIEAVNETLTALPDENPAQDEEQDDETQRRINRQCGELVLRFVELMPQDVSGLFLRIDKIRNLTAETIGKGMREALSKWTIIKLVDAGMFHALPNLMPGVWDGVEGRERFSPRQVDENGRLTREVAPLKFNLPVAPQEVRREEEIRHRNNRVAEAALRASITNTMDIQIKAIIRNFIVAQWAKFQQRLDNFIESHGSDYGKKLKETLDFICRKIFFEAVASILEIMAYPIYKFVWYFVMYYLDNKAKDIIQNFHLDANRRFIEILSKDIMEQLKVFTREAKA